MNSAIKRKRGPKPSGEKKVVFYARVNQESYMRLEAYLAAGCPELGALVDPAPGDISIPGDVARELTRESKDFAEFKEKVKPYEVKKARPPLKLSPEVAEQVRPNFFKK